MTESLWRHRDFVRFWSGQTISMVGSAVSFIALPLVAVLSLHATATDMGVLTAAELLPPLLIGPLVGPLVDQVSRRRLMLCADLGRAALLAWVTVGAALGILAMWQMITVAFGVGALTLVFNVAYQSFLPNVVDRERLTDSNAKLSASGSIAEVSGPGLAAWLIAVGGASVAVLADAISYVLSFASVLSMRVRDTRPRDTTRSLRTFRADLVRGFHLLWQDRVLRTVVGSNAVLAFFAQLQNAVYFLFLVRTLHLTAAMIGLLFTVSAAGGFVAALVCDRISTRFGLGRLIVLGQLTLIAGGILLASASGSRFASSVFIVAGESCFSAGLSLFGVGYTSLFQFRTGDDVRGRVLGAAKFTTAAAVPVAAIGGGLIASAFSPRTALVVGAAGMAMGLLAVLRPRILGLSAHAEAEAPRTTISASPTQPAQAAPAIPLQALDKSDVG